MSPDSGVCIKPSQMRLFITEQLGEALSPTAYLYFGADSIFSCCSPEDIDSGWRKGRARHLTPTGQNPDCDEFASMFRSDMAWWNWLQNSKGKPWAPPHAYAILNARRLRPSAHAFNFFFDPGYKLWIADPMAAAKWGKTHLIQEMRPDISGISQVTIF